MGHFHVKISFLFLVNDICSEESTTVDNDNFDLQNRHNQDYEIVQFDDRNITVNTVYSIHGYHGQNGRVTVSSVFVCQSGIVEIFKKLRCQNYPKAGESIQK